MATGTNVWAVVAGVVGYLPLTALTGLTGQLLGMNVGATAAEWKAATFLSNQLAVPVGTVAAPSYVFTGSLGTGFYAPAADQVALSLVGTQRLLFTASLASITGIPLRLVGQILQEAFSADIVAAATTDLGNATGNVVNVTNAAGATPISSLGGATLPSGTEIETIISIAGGSVSLTHNAVSLILLGGANLALVDKDIIRWRKINGASAYWKMVGFQRGVSSSSIANKGDWIVGTLSGGIIVPQVQPVWADGFFSVADSTQNSGWSGVSVAAWRNRIINGCFRFDQNREGLSAYTIPTTGQTLDMWSGGAVAASGQFTVIRELGGLNLGEYNALLTVTTADAAIAAGDFYQFFTAIEGYNVADLAFGTASAQQFTISFEVSCNLVGTYGLYMYNGAANRSYVGQFTVNAANTKEKKTLTLTGDLAGTWLATNGIGIYVGVTLAAGTTFQTATGAWTAGQFLGTAGNTNFMATNANVMRLGRFELEKGAVATPFERRSYGTELALVQRYYFKTYNQGIVPGTASVPGAAGSNAAGAGVGQCVSWVKFPVSMRATPTMAYYSPITGGLGLWRRSVAGADVTWQTVALTGMEGDMGNNGAAVTAAEICYGHALANARLS